MEDELSRRNSLPSSSSSTTQQRDIQQQQREREQYEREQQYQIDVRIRRHPELQPFVPSDRFTPLTANSMLSANNSHPSKSLTSSSRQQSEKFVSMTRLDQLAQPKKINTRPLPTTNQQSGTKSFKNSTQSIRAKTFNKDLVQQQKRPIPNKPVAPRPPVAPKSSRQVVAHPPTPRPAPKVIKSTTKAPSSTASSCEPNQSKPSSIRSSSARSNNHQHQLPDVSLQSSPPTLNLLETNMPSPQQQQPPASNLLTPASTPGVPASSPQANPETIVQTSTPISNTPKGIARESTPTALSYAANNHLTEEVSELSIDDRHYQSAEFELNDSKNGISNSDSFFSEKSKDNSNLDSSITPKAENNDTLAREEEERQLRLEEEDKKRLLAEEEERRKREEIVKNILDRLKPSTTDVSYTQRG